MGYENRAVVEAHRHEFFYFPRAIAEPSMRIAEPIVVTSIIWIKVCQSTNPNHGERRIEVLRHRTHAKFSIHPRGSLDNKFLFAGQVDLQHLGDAAAVRHPLVNLSNMDDQIRVLRHQPVNCL